MEWAGLHFFLLGFIHFGSLNLRSLPDPFVDVVRMLLLDGSNDIEECLDVSTGLAPPRDISGDVATESSAGGIWSCVFLPSGLPASSENTFGNRPPLVLA